MGGPVAISLSGQTKRGNIFVDVSSLLCYNDNNHETKISITKGEHCKNASSPLCFLNGFKNMITQDNEKIKSTFKKIFLLMYYYCLCQIYPCYGHFLTLGIIRKTATTIERSVI